MTSPLFYYSYFKLIPNPNPEEVLTVIVGAKDLNDEYHDEFEDYDTVTAKIQDFIIHPGYKAHREFWL